MCATLQGFPVHLVLFFQFERENDLVGYASLNGDLISLPQISMKALIAICIYKAFSFKQHYQLLQINSNYIY